MKSFKTLFIAFVLIALSSCSTTQQSANSPPLHQTCMVWYSSSDTQAICRTFNTNADVKCDSAMREILVRRSGSVASACSQTNTRPPVPTCNLSTIAVQNMASRDICNSYFDNRAPACDDMYRRELSRRNQKINPRNECGASNVSTQAQTTTMTSQARPQQDTLIKPASQLDKCESFIDQLSKNSNPMNAACTARYKSLDDETIMCRSELVLFINTNSLGTGTNFSSCGGKSYVNYFDESRIIKSFYYFRDKGPKELATYFRQFTANNKSACEALVRNNDAEGYFCLYRIELAAKNYEPARKALEQATKRGHPVANYETYKAAEKSTVKEFRAESENALIASAMNGFYLSQVDLGWRYMDPKSTSPKNYKKAMFWNLKSVDLGSGEGASNVGLLYQKGWGVPVNLEKAIEWHERGIRMGYAWSGQAEVELAGIYERGGKGVEKNTAEAVRLYRRVINDLPSVTPERKVFAENKLKVLEK